MEERNNYLINKIFTVPYIDKLIENGIAPDSFLKCIKRYEQQDFITYGEAISEIYHYMDASYRNEYYFKNTVFNQLLIEKHDLYSTAALTELPIADSKVDFVMINGKGVAYEIKTDLDNFNRLESQIEDYYKVFCYVNVVVGYKNYKKIKEVLKDSFVGIYVLYENGNLLCRKKARYYNKKLSYEIMFQLLRKKEFECILLKHFGKLPQVNNFKYYRECLEWIKKININTFQKDVITCLKERTLLVVEEDFEKKVPFELSFYIYFSKKNRVKYDLLNDFLSRRVEV